MIRLTLALIGSAGLAAGSPLLQKVQPAAESQAMAPALEAFSTHIEGVRWYRLIDPDCPDNPDSFEKWVVYNDDSENFVGDTFGGTSTYLCNVYKPATNSQAYNDCLNGINTPHGCQDLGTSWSPHP